MDDIFMIIIIIWVLLGSISSFIEFIIMTEVCCTSVIYSPSVIYENTRLNWFACWFLFILIRLFNFWVTIIGLIVHIVAYMAIFFKWLFTVCRKGLRKITKV